MKKKIGLVLSISAAVFVVLSVIAVVVVNYISALVIGEGFSATSTYEKIFTDQYTETFVENNPSPRRATTHIFLDDYYDDLDGLANEYQSYLVYDDAGNIIISGKTAYVKQYRSMGGNYNTTDYFVGTTPIETVLSFDQRMDIRQQIINLDDEQWALRIDSFYQERDIIYPVEVTLFINDDKTTYYCKDNYQVNSNMKYIEGGNLWIYSHDYLRLSESQLKDNEKAFNNLKKEMKKLVRKKGFESRFEVKHKIGFGKYTEFITSKNKGYNMVVAFETEYVSIVMKIAAVAIGILLVLVAIVDLIIILIMWGVKLRRLNASIILLLIIPALLSLDMKTRAEDWESLKLITTPTIIFEADNIKTELESADFYHYPVYFKTGGYETLQQVLSKIKNVTSYEMYQTSQNSVVYPYGFARVSVYADREYILWVQNPYDYTIPLEECIAIKQDSFYVSEVDYKVTGSMTIDEFLDKMDGYTVIEDSNKFTIKVGEMNINNDRDVCLVRVLGNEKNQFDTYPIYLYSVGFDFYEDDLYDVTIEDVLFNKDDYMYKYYSGQLDD